MPCAAAAVSERRSWTASPARNTLTSWPSSAAVRATSSASAARVGFSGPVARWTRIPAMRRQRIAGGALDVAQLDRARCRSGDQLLDQRLVGVEHLGRRAALDDPAVVD